jgi:hypothetical protein
MKYIDGFRNGSWNTIRLTFDGFDSNDSVVRYNFTQTLAAHCGGDALLLRKVS